MGGGLLHTPHHVFVQSEDGKAVTLTNEDGLDSGSIKQPTSVRLTTLVFTNTLPSIRPGESTFSVEFLPYSVNPFDTNKVTRSIELRTDNRYTLTSLIHDIVTKWNALPAVNGILPSDHISFEVFADRGVLEVKGTGVWQFSVLKNDALGFDKKYDYVNPVWTAAIESGATISGTVDIQPTNYTKSNYLINLAATDVVHVSCSIVSGEDTVTNMSYEAREIIHTVPMTGTFGVINAHVNIAGSPVSFLGGHISDFTVRLLGRNLKELDFQNQGWFAALELGYD